MRSTGSSRCDTTPTAAPVRCCALAHLPAKPRFAIVVHTCARSAWRASLICVQSLPTPQQFICRLQVVAYRSGLAVARSCQSSIRSPAAVLLGYAAPHTQTNCVRTSGPAPETLCSCCAGLGSLRPSATSSPSSPQHCHGTSDYLVRQVQHPMAMSDIVMAAL